MNKFAEHWFKSVRNTFIKNNFLFTDKTTICEIFENEKNKITKKLPKITQQHVYPNNFDKMKVKFSVQILSNTTASAIRAVCDETNDSLFSDSNIVKYALSTAKICEMFNNCFDCFNKVKIFNKDLQRTKVGYIDAYEYLKYDMLKFLHSLEYNSDAICINGLIQSFNAILLIADLNFQSDPTVSFISASHFNQDPLENMFSKIRANGGFNRHPNAHQIGKIFSKIICLKLVLHSTSSNCENDDQNIMNDDWNQLIVDCRSINDVNYNSENVETENLSNHDNIYQKC